MGFKEVLSKLGERKRQDKEMLRLAEKKMRIQKVLEERQLSANERELNRFMDEEREEEIKEALEMMRRKRRDDISFNHNPLNVKNITNHTEWEVLKEKNMFNKKGNMFSNQEFIHKNNPKLLKNNRRLCGI